MRSKGRVYAIVLLIGLIFTSAVLNSDVVRGLTSNSDVSLATDGSTYVLGQDVIFTGQVALAADEVVVLERLRLRNTSGKQPLDIDLPLGDTGGAFADVTDENLSGSLKVKITTTGLSSTLPSTLPGTIPASTLPAGSTETYTAGSSGGTIDVVAVWTPPVNLSPIPDLTLIPQIDEYYTIPTLVKAADASGTKLGSTDFAWGSGSTGGDVPTAGQTAGTALPDVSGTGTFAVPQITLSTNAPSGVADLPDSTAYMGTGSVTAGSGFPIPGASTATSSAATFPAATDAFAIPSPTIGTSGVTAYGSGADEQWVVPDNDGATNGDQVIKGLVHDGTNFWFILAGSSNDILIKTNSSGARQTGVVLPSNSFDGITAVGNSLYLVENEWRCWDDIDTDGACVESRVYKIAASGTLPSAGTTESNWAAADDNAITGIFSIGSDWDRFGGLATGASSDLWTMDKEGSNFYNYRTTGIEKNSFQGEWTQGDAIAFNENLIYTAKGSVVTRWNTTGGKIADWDLGGSVSIKGLTFDSNLIYFADNNDGKLYASFVGKSITSPVTSRGLAYSTISTETAVWILVDGSPKDYIVKVDPSDGSLIANFGTDENGDGTKDGWAQAPSADTEGIEYFNSALYIIANEGSGWEANRMVYKVNATTGDTESSVNLKDYLDWIEDMGDITNDGTNLVMWTKSNWDDVYIVPTSLDEVNQQWVDANGMNGAKGLAYHPGQAKYYAVNGDSVKSFDSSWNRQDELTLTSTSSISSVQGAAFIDSGAYNDFWFTSGTQVYHSFIAETATTKPKAIAYSPSDAPGQSVASLWVIVDGDPFDKIMRINTDDGALNTTFDTDGVADAPSGEVDAMVFVTEGTSNYLYMVANDPGWDMWNKTKNLYKYSITSKTVESGYPKNLENANVWNDVGSMVYNGTDLIMGDKDGQSVWRIGTDGSQKAEGWPCCTMSWGGLTGMAYHETRDTLYGAVGSSLVGISPTVSYEMSFLSEDTLTLAGSQITDQIDAMVFGGDVLYTGRSVGNDGFITASAFAADITTKPQGLGLSPSSALYQGQNIGAALWVLVDGTPVDRVIKLTGSGTSWSADTDFGSDSTKNGSADMPTAGMAGVTFYDNALWVIGVESYQTKLWKLKPTTGEVISTYNLCGGDTGGHMMGGGGDPGGGDNNMCDTPGGLAVDTAAGQLIATGEMQERFWFIDGSDGSIVRASNSQYMLGGAEAAEYIASDKSYWTTYYGQIQQWVNPFANDIWPADNFDAGSGSGSLQNVKGLVANQTTKNFYIGWNDGSDGYISQAVPPSPITNEPVDLGYDPASQTLYILVNGKGGDVVVATNVSTGAVKTDDDGNQMFYTLNTEDAYGLTVIDSEIYIAAVERCDGGGCGGPQPTAVTVLDADLASVRTFQMNTDMGDVLGLASDGSELIATSQYGGPRIDTFDKESGNQRQNVHFWDPNNPGWMEEGFQDVAYSATTTLYFVAKGDWIGRVDEEGMVSDSWYISDPNGTGLNWITGVTFVGNSLYIADENNAKIYKALIPQPDITITNTPRAMTTDGSSLWIAVDAEPVDKIIKMVAQTSTLQVVASFDSPGTETDGLAIKDGKLYALVNDTRTIEQPGGAFQITLPVLVSMNKDNGQMLSEGPLFEEPPGSFETFMFMTPVGGLVYDGQYFLTGTKGDPGSPGSQGAMYRFDPNNTRQKNMFGKMISGPLAEEVFQYSGQFPTLGTMTAFALGADGTIPNDRRFIVAGAPGFGNLSDRITRYDLEAVQNVTGGSGSVAYDSYEITGRDITGMAVVGTVLFMADSSGALFGTALPENTGVEMTIIGDYAADFRATTSASTYSAAAVNYAIARNTSVAVQLTSPGVNFVATSTSATIAGRVSDPAIASVSVGIQLPFTEFLSDSGDTNSSDKWGATVDYGSSAVTWHAPTTGNPGGAGQAWRFGKIGETNFSDGDNRVGASLTSNEIFPISSDSTLEFNTAWDTEFMPDMDIKRIQVATVTKDVQGIDVVGPYKTIGQVVQFVDTFMGMPPVDDKHPSLFEWLAVPPLPFEPDTMHPRMIPLGALAGQRLKVRFKFDSFDSYANDGKGWYLDDITLSGAGTKTISIATTPLATPVVVDLGGSVGTVTMFKSFSTSFSLAEGENILVSSAVQPYGPNLSATTSLQGFVDTKVPVIALSGVPANTNSVVQTLVVNVVEPTINQPGAMLELRHNLTTPAGATSSVVIAKVTKEGDTNVGVSLKEGINTFVAVATDGGGLQATIALTSIVDLTGPTAQVSIIPVSSSGEAIIGDQYFVVVAAQDSLSGVAEAELTSGGGLAAIADVPQILIGMHSLGFVGAATSTHVTLSRVQTGTPVGVEGVSVTITDKAGNSSVASGQLNVVSARSNRNYFLFPGFNFMGLALIPDDDNDGTSDDASMDRLMSQNVTAGVSEAFASSLGGSVTLGDVVESTFSFNRAGNFITHTPGPAADTLTEMAPFQGMNVKTKESDGGGIGVFRKVSVTGFSAQQSVPVRVNIQGVFLRPGQLPPGLEMRVGYNLIAPHILDDSLFETVFRGALVPRELAVSALSFERRVDAKKSGGTIKAEVYEGFSTNSMGDTLKPEMSYWTFIASDPLDTRVNDLGDPLGPRITPQ